jgi:hypothetical protein
MTIENVIILLNGLESIDWTNIIQSIKNKNFSDTGEYILEDILAIVAPFWPPAIPVMYAVELFQSLQDSNLVSLSPVTNPVAEGQTTPPSHGWIGR